MGLAERDYARAGYSTPRSESKIVLFVKETYKLFGASLMAGAVGAYIGVPLAVEINSMYFLLFAIEIALLIGLHFVKNKPGVNLLVMFAFVFMTGITTSPLLSYTLGINGGGVVIANAFAMTSIVFGSMSFYAIKTKKDFTQYGKPLFIALIVIIAFSIINIFLGSSVFQIGISAAVTLLFSVMIIYDTQNIMSGRYDTPIDGAIALYLDFLNIFISLLQLFGLFNSND